MPSAEACDKSHAPQESGKSALSSAERKTRRQQALGCDWAAGTAVGRNSASHGLCCSSWRKSHEGAGLGTHGAPDGGPQPPAPLRETKEPFHSPLPLVTTRPGAITCFLRQSVSINNSLRNLNRPSHCHRCCNNTIQSDVFIKTRTLRELCARAPWCFGVTGAWQQNTRAACQGPYPAEGSPVP